MRRTIFALTLSAALAACSTPWLPDPTAGSMAVRVDWSSSAFGIRAIPAEARSLTVLVLSNKVGVARQTLTPQSPRAKFEKLPVGTVMVVATAADSAGRMVAAGRTSVQIEGGKTSRAELELGPPEKVKEELNDLLGQVAGVLLEIFKDQLQPVTAPTPASPTPDPARTPLAPSPPPQTARFESFVLEGISNLLNGPATVPVGSVVKGYMRVSGDIDLTAAKAFAAINGPEGPQFLPLDADLSQFEGPFTVDMTGLKVLGDYTVVVSVSDNKGHSLTTPVMQFRLVPPR